MTLCGRKVLTVLSSVFAVCALGLLGIAVSTDYWLYLEEGVILPLNQSTELRMSLHSGLWRVCFTAGDEKGRCFTIEYVMPTNVQLTSESTVSVLTPEPTLSPSCVVGPIQWEIQSAIQEALSHDPTPPDTPAGKTYVLASVRPQLMQWYHTSLSSGHPRITRTMELLTRKFWWSSLTADVRDYVLSCPVCTWAKSPRQLPTGKLEHLPTPHGPWSHIAMNFLTDLLNSSGFTTILVVVDQFSKVGRLIPLPYLPNAMEMAECMFQQVFCLYGIPVRLQGVASLLRPAGSLHQPILRIPSPSQRADGTPESGNGEVPSPTLHPPTTRVESLSSLGRIRTELPGAFLPPSHYFSVCPRTPTHVFPWETEPGTVPDIDECEQVSTV
ncbi:uncharacterized protein LOC112265074 isoform X1 [Oncorhynchus tshawytscha]|uniref:uncharacterized protein LOC112265074 isoform X1 n=1 Tax=Oncorhynchus tshawytscha TaxID=74940 RepID=UPI001C3E3079|nr:uncharacterized protein LOC112265074 isoform X1 [Oncorhynchus tshawytscha]